MCHERSDTLGLKSLGNCVLVFLENCVWVTETQAQRTNPGQNFVDKFTKSSKIGLSVECYTTDFSQFSSTTVKIFLFSGRLGTCHGFEAFQGIPWNFLISWIPDFRQLVWQIVHSLSGDNNLVPLHLWWSEIVLKPEKVYKYFLQDHDLKSIVFFIIYVNRV